VRLFLRLTADVNDRLRTLMRYHAELSRYVDDALTWLDLLAPRRLHKTPNEASSARATLRLKSHGIRQVRPLRGGVDACESMVAARGSSAILESRRTPGHSKDAGEVRAD
jgi:hypothetical protein